MERSKQTNIEKTGRIWRTSLREELGVDALKSLLVYHAAGTLLLGRKHTHSRVNKVFQCYLTPIICRSGGGGKVSEKSFTDVFESPVEDLQLFPAEVGLLNESVEPLGSVAHRRQLGFIRCIFFKQRWSEEKVREEGRGEEMREWWMFHIFPTEELKLISGMMTVDVWVLTLALIGRGAGARAIAGQQFEEALL